MFDRPRPATVLALTTAAAISVSLTGCGDSTASASPESPSAQATHSTPAATGSSSTAGRADPTSSPHSSNTTAAGAPGVPEPARRHSKNGAIAFSEYYTHQVNKLGVSPKKGVLDKLSLGHCKTCQNAIETIDQNVRKNTRFDGKQAIIVRSYSPYLHKKKPSVWVVTKSPEVHIVNKDGITVQTIKKRSAVGMVFRLKWTADGWRVSEVEVDKAVTS